jgi:hypothetical protein
MRGVPVLQGRSRLKIKNPLAPGMLRFRDEP